MGRRHTGFARSSCEVAVARARMAASSGLQIEALSAISPSEHRSRLIRIPARFVRSFIMSPSVARGQRSGREPAPGLVFVNCPRVTLSIDRKWLQSDHFRIFGQSSPQWADKDLCQRSVGRCGNRRGGVRAGGGLGGIEGFGTIGGATVSFADSGSDFLCRLIFAISSGANTNLPRFIIPRIFCI